MGVELVHCRCFQLNLVRVGNGVARPTDPEVLPHMVLSGFQGIEICLQAGDKTTRAFREREPAVLLGGSEREPVCHDQQSFGAIVHEGTSQVNSVHPGTPRHPSEITR